MASGPFIGFKPVSREVHMRQRLETNRIKDPAATLHTSSQAKLALLGVVAVLMALTGLACTFDGHQFTMGAIIYLATGRWEAGAAVLVPLAVMVVLSAALMLVIRLALRWFVPGGDRGRVVAKGATRVDAYAKSMGFGQAVEKVSLPHARQMAERLVRGYDGSRMAPGYPLGVNHVSHDPISTSWEDMAIVLAGPRTGKSLCYAIPACLSAPGPLLATSNKGDIVDVTMPVRMHDHPRGRCWVFDPEHIVDPGLKKAPWVWDIIGSISDMSDAQRIAACWRYASGQPEDGGNDYFTGSATQQLADCLFAAAVGERSVTDVFKWASNERDSTPADILSQAGWGLVADRINGVIGLTPETRSGVYGSFARMVSFLADPAILDWIYAPPGDTRPRFDAYDFATSEDSLYLLSQQGRPSTALTASLTAMVAFSAFTRAQSEFQDNNRRLPVPLCCVLDEAANICRWPELSDIYSYFGSAGIPIMTIWQNPSQGAGAFGETSFRSLYDNANVKVYLGGISDTKFLKDLSDQIGRYELLRSSLSDTAGGKRSVQRSVQSDDILTVSRLAEWPVGRALVQASQCRSQIVDTRPWTTNARWMALQKTKTRNERSADNASATSVQAPAA